eukprot:scaffold1349_cov94-Skeletonema_menzelii.AAC.1
MELTTRYNNIKNTMAGLNIMRNNWAGNKWSNSQVDLHHALLGKSLGGGVAYVGVVCNKNYGMGVSTSISGSFSSMGAGVVWDSMVFTHEIGHNFASGHTFNGYSPPVDTCMRNSKCPSGGIEDDSATLMSYCHICGGFKKVEYTFGGEYDGSGSKSLVSNWKKSDLLGRTSASVNPQRVPHKMYQHISSRGSCVAVPASPKPTPTPTTSPSSRPSASPTKAPTSAPTSNPTTSPSSQPSASPTKAPTSAPTFNPMTSPSFKPSASPTKDPTGASATSKPASPSSSKPPSSTKAPTSAPTFNPTTSPSTKPSASPTKAPTSVPTFNPTTSPSSKPSASPTQAPTSAPTSNPTTSPSFKPTAGPEIAQYHKNLGGPKCSTLTSHCKSGDLLRGRGNLPGGGEPNTPNSLDDCTDGNGGKYTFDESIEAIELQTLSGNKFQAGEEVEISVQVYAYGDGSKSVLDLWYAEDASDPIWQYIGTKLPDGGGFRTITATYVLPNSKKTQAVRGLFRFSYAAVPAESACPVFNTWTDVDTLSIVTIESEGLEEPTDGGTVDGDGSNEGKKRRGGKKKKKNNHED